MLQEKIIEILKAKGEYFSGEEISSHLKVSRQALWKHIHELREIGYDIVAVPHLGYQLISSPDRLLPQEINYGLNTKFIGKKIYYFESVSSTMDIAWQLGMVGASEGTLILAETQTKGRGRLKRSWISPKYKGIYLSLILKPKMPPVKAPILTLLVSVSICGAIKELTDLDVKIKWPNDILIQNRKLGGILTEINAETDQIHFMVVGIGLNVNNDKDSLPQGATSLKEVKRQNLNRIDLVQEILRKIESNYLCFKERGASPIIEEWRNFNVTLGKRIKVIYQDSCLEGQAIDIDVDGGLLLRKDSGVIQKLMSADIVHCR